MVWQILQPAINMGLEEEKFWNMTVAEIERFMNGATWRMRTKAQFDYALANLIGISSARMMSNDVKFPAISEVYPDLFKMAVEEQPNSDLVVSNEETTKSVNNFLAAAMAINAAKKKSGGEHKE